MKLHITRVGKQVFVVYWFILVAGAADAHMGLCFISALLLLSPCII